MSAVVEPDAVEVLGTIVLDALADLARTVEEVRDGSAGDSHLLVEMVSALQVSVEDLWKEVIDLRSDLTEIRAEVAPVIASVQELGPMAEKLATGGLLGLFRQG